MLQTNQHPDLSPKPAQEEPKVVSSIALVFHQLRDGEIATTRHKIVNNKLGIGSLVNPSEAMRAIEASAKKRAIRTTKLTLMPATVLFDSIDYLCWYKPSFQAQMWFKIGTEVTNCLVKWPSLLFVANKNTSAVRIFSLATSQRPKLSTPVYLAPLMNINGNGYLCSGSATWPQAIDYAAMPEIERALIDSNFTHANYRDTGNPVYDIDHLQVAFWTKKGNRRERVYANEMIRHTTLSELLSSL